MEQLIPDFRRNAELRLRKFREEYGVWTAPVDVFRLLRSMEDSGKLPLEWRQDDRFLDQLRARLGGKRVDGVTYGLPAGGYLIVTRSVPLNWKRYSAWRRHHFTLAHELGHLFCGHMAVPYESKSPAVIRLEEAEADTFAAELLAPAEVLGNFRGVKEAADALWISESAVRRRMRDTGVLFALRTCPECGFHRIPPAADYCRMCGRSLRKIPRPPAEPEIRYFPPPPEECPVCGLKENSAPEGRCMNCDNPKQNHCLPEYDQRQHRCPQDALFCEVCGAPTLYAELIPPAARLSASTRLSCP